MSFQVGDKVLLNAVVLGYIDNDPRSPKPYYQLGLPNGNVTIALCDNVHHPLVLTNPIPHLVEAEAYKENHYREKKKL